MTPIEKLAEEISCKIGMPYFSLPDSGLLSKQTLLSLAKYILQREKDAYIAGGNAVYGVGKEKLG